MDKSVKKKMQIVLLVTVLMSMLLFLNEIRTSRIFEIKRNSYGGGSKRGQYEVTVGGQLSEETIDLEINEREYTEAEIRRVFKDTMDKLEKLILGKNKNVDHVEYDLNLITKMPDTPIEITWQSDRNDIVNSLGEIQEENLTNVGELVELKGYLTYGKEECLYIINIMVYPRTLSGKEKLLKSIREMVESVEKGHRENPVVTLPAEIDGKKIVWKEKAEHKAVYILVLGGIVAVLIYVQDRQKKEKLQKEKERQMQSDYSEIVSQISLLVGTGMTVKNAWGKIAANYQESQKSKGLRYAYEEMVYTVREMQGGISESECYEHFGKRCGLVKYMKLGTLLSQNMRKGTKGLVKLLDDEAEQALEEKRQMTKKQGEETSTKLLLPMSLMLIVVLIIVIVPAFLSIGL